MLMAHASEELLSNLKILVVDHNGYMRRLTRIMLSNIGVKSVLEAADGLLALELIRGLDPDAMLLDWDLPLLNGAELMRIVRSPGMFSRPNLPTIMLSARANPTHVREAMRLGVHEYLLKPTSPQALFDRLASVILKPRPMVDIDGCYVPMPRELLHRSDSRRDEDAELTSVDGQQIAVGE